MAEKEHGQAAGKRGGKLPLIIGVVAILLLNGLLLGKVMMSEGKTEKKEEHEEEKVGEKVPLEEFLVNLAGGEGRYLKATIALGLKEGVAGEHFVEEELAPIRDAVISVLSNQNAEEISTEKGRAKLKKELKERINKAIHKEEVVKVYFLSFATQ